MAKKVEIELDVTGNVVESTKNLKAMKQELKGLDVGTAEFKKLFNEIDDLEDKIKSAKGASSDWVDSLENAGGPLGMVGAGINKVKVATQSWGAALKATGIGLIVSLIGGLVAAFSQTEGSLKKLEPLMIGMEKIFGGIVEVAMPLVDMMLDLGLKALPYVTTGFKYVYASVAALFSYIKNMGGAVVKVWKGIFTFDWKTIKEGVSDMGATFGKVADSFTEATERFDKGASKMTKTQKKNKEDADKLAADALAKKLKNMEAQDKIDEATLEKMKAEALALATTEQQKLNVEEAFAKKSYELKKKDLEDKRALYKEGTDEYKGYTADLIKLDADYTNTKKANEDKQKELDKKAIKDKMDEEIGALNLRKAKGEIKEKEYQEELYKIKKKYTTDKKELSDLEIAHEQSITDAKKKEATEQRNIALGKLQDEMNDLDAKNALFEYDYEEDLKRLKKKKEDLDAAQALELANADLTEYEITQIKQKYADKRKEITKQEIDTEKAAKEAKTQIALTYLQALQGFGALMQQLADGNKDVAITGLLIEKAASLAVIAISAQKNFIKDGGVTSPLAWANLAVAGVSAATIIVQAVKGVNDIKNAGKGASAASGPVAGVIGERQTYGQGGMIDGPSHQSAAGGTLINAEGGESIINKRSTGMFMPLLSAINQAGGGTSFASNVMNGAGYDNPQSDNTFQPIIKTYVVSTEMTSTQERTARLKDLSTL